jgi:hypothetical protein
VPYLDQNTKNAECIKRKRSTTTTNARRASVVRVRGGGRWGIGGVKSVGERGMSYKFGF